MNLETPAQRSRVNVGIGLFIALSVFGSWSVAATLRVLGATIEPQPLGTRLLTVSLLYAVTMGWQPLVATWVVRRWIDPPAPVDLGLRGTPPLFTLVGGVGALVLAGTAALAAVVLTSTGLQAPVGSPTPIEPTLTSHGASGLGALLLVLAFAGTLLLVWLQAFAEEVGWRGYLLPRAMERFGRWRGLLVHGAVWGLWYAPMLFFTTFGHTSLVEVVTKGVGFTVTCVLLGCLLGWLRLVSDSLVPVVVANTTLTLAAGLPYWLHGFEVGERSAIYLPTGWLVLVPAVAALFASRWGGAIRQPRALKPDRHDLPRPRFLN
jgi:uncharacterized protein